MQNVTGHDLARCNGGPQNGSELLPLVYEELRCLAAARLAREKPGHTLQPTALVHEAWLRVRGNKGEHWESRGHFFAAAAQAMRRILTDKARRKRALKHGGNCGLVDFPEIDIAAPVPDDELIALDEALQELESVDSAAARLVDLRFFVGLTQAEAAEELGISRSSADRLWKFARAWLFSRVSNLSDPEAETGAPAAC